VPEGEQVEDGDILIVLEVLDG